MARRERTLGIAVIALLGAITGCGESPAPDGGPPDAGADGSDAATSRVASLAAAAAARTGDEIDVEELYWNPEAFPELYPEGGTGSFRRFFVPPCRDGSEPADRRCPDGEPVRCTDGTRPVYYFRAGTTDRWLIRIQNGGLGCAVDHGDRDVSASTSNCWNRYGHQPENRHALTSIGSAAVDELEGIYREDAANPLSEYNMIFFDKCVGDRNLGDRTVEAYHYRDETDPLAPVLDYVGPVYFHGFLILEAALRGLAAEPGIAELGLVAFQTHSNGSNGLYMYLDRLAELTRAIHPGAEVRGIATGMVKASLEVEATADDAGLTHHEQVYDRLDDYGSIALHVSASGASPVNGQWISPRVFMEDGLEWVRSDGWGAIDETPTVDQSCLDAHPGEIAPCLDHMHVLLNHISTPLFVVAQQRDATVNTTQHLFVTAFDTTSGCDPGATCCHDENYLPGQDCTVVPERPFYTLRPTEYAPADLADRITTTARAFWEGFSTRSEMRPDCAGSPCDPSPLPAPPHAGFFDDATDHRSVHEDERARAAIDGRSLAEYLAGWLEAGTPTFCVDVSGGEVATSGTAAAWAPCPP